MKRLLAVPICVLVLSALCHAGSNEYKYTKFDDFWKNRSSYVGGKVEINAFGRYAGGVLFVAREPGNADFLHINLDSLQDNERKFIQKSCLPHCNMTVRGSVEKDRLGLIVIRGESISVENY